MCVKYMCVFMHMNSGPGEGQKRLSERILGAGVTGSELDLGVGSVLNG